MKILQAFLLFTFLPLLTTGRYTKSDVSEAELKQIFQKRGIKPTRNGTRRVKSKGSKGGKGGKGGKGSKGGKSKKSDKSKPENTDPVQPPNPSQPTVPKTWKEKCPEIEKNNTSVYSLSLSDDGNTIAIGYFGFVSIFKFDFETGICEEIGSFERVCDADPCSGQQTSVSLSGDGNTVAVALPEVSVYTFLQGSNATWFNPHPNKETIEASGVLLSKNGARVAIADATAEGIQGVFQGKVAVYGVNDWVQLGEDIWGAKSEDLFGHSMAFGGKNGKRLAIAAYAGNYARIYDWNNENASWDQIHEETAETEQFPQLTVSFSKNGKIFALGSSSTTGTNNFVRISKYKKLKEEWEQLGQDISDFGQRISLSNNGKRIAVAKGGIAQIFQYKKILNEWISISGNIQGANNAAISLSGDGKTFAIGKDSFTNVQTYA